MAYSAVIQFMYSEMRTPHRKPLAFRPPDNSPFGRHLTRGVLLCVIFSRNISEVDLVKYLVQALIKRLLHSKSLLNINVVNLAVLAAYDTVADTLL